MEGNYLVGGNGALVELTDGGFDVGVRIGTQGAGQGDVFPTFSFILSAENYDLTLADLSGQQVGVRIQSTGEGELGEGSVKVIEELPTLPQGEEDNFEGLSHGYWKNHVDDWDGITVSQSFEDFFCVDGNWIVQKDKNGTTYQDDIDFAKALNGPAYGSAQNILAMQAVAAVLNALDEDINYKYSVSEIKDLVQDAWGDNEAMLTLAAELDALNNLGDLFV